MTSKPNQSYDFDEHKRKIFLEHLNPKTTRESLREYLAGFELEVCVVPYKEGKSQGYGFVIFRKESSVNNVMSKRPHTIDGQRVEMYRSVPDQGSLKEKKGIKELIVSGFKNKSITKSDLENCFCGFGTINNINMYYDDASCCVEFDDYDSVDKALLDRPHIIKNIELQVTKGSRKNQFDDRSSYRTTQAAYSNNTSPMEKKSNRKQVQIDPQISSMNVPEKVYRVHIMNLPSNVDAEFLSKKFTYSMGNILISSPMDNQSAPIECWLKGMDDRQTAENFVQEWDGTKMSGSTIDCEVQEDNLEFCNKFRIGTCPKSNEECDWEHITCTANGRCSSDCRHGHEEGTKTGLKNDSSADETYRLRITGFQRRLTPDILAQLLNEKKCFVNRYDNTVGYLGPLRTIKYARRLLAKWHNRSIDGLNLKCQIEWNPRSSTKKSLSRAGSMSNLVSKENDSRRPHRSRQQTNDSTSNSRDSSISRTDSNSSMRVVNDLELNNEGRIFRQSTEDLRKQRDSDIKLKNSSIENLSLSFDRKSQSLNQISGGNRNMTTLRSKSDHGSLAFLVEYNDADEETYRRELNALKLLKGVKGVVELIELKKSSDNHEQQSSSKSKLSFIAKHVPGNCLKEFANKIHRGGFTILEAIQLVQNLITIIEQVHLKGVLHQNLGPDSIMIEWDSKQTSVDQAQLTLINFSQAHIISEKSTQTNQPISGTWYKAPQASIESFEYSSTIDASAICAILFWLLTNTDPQHDRDILPHQQDKVTDKIDNRITSAVRNANTNTKQPVDETQLKTYLVDTFNTGFGYPHYHQPWTIGSLKCRLESIRELLSPRNSKLDSTDAIFKDLVSTYNHTPHPSSSTTTAHSDIFQKAAMAFREAKASFLSSDNQYSWSDGGCTWLDIAQTTMNERRHDDILTYEYRSGRTQYSCSIIVTCLAILIDEGSCIILSIGSTVNGKIIRIPVSRCAKTQNFPADLQKNFTNELGNLVKSIAKERRTTSQ